MHEQSFLAFSHLLADLVREHKVNIQRVYKLAAGQEYPVEGAEAAHGAS